MSKIGQKPITIPTTVTADIAGSMVTIKGKEGEMKILLPEGITAAKEDASLVVKRAGDAKKMKSLHGLFRSLLANAVLGVETPWEKKLEVVGTGFNVKLQGEDLVFKVGYNHPVVFSKVDRVKYAVEGNNKVTLKSVDKQLVGEIAYKVKMIRKPDVYKGKGIKYAGERLRIKPGKKAQKTA